METLERLDALETRIGHLEIAVTDAKTQAGAARTFTEDAWAIVPRIYDRMEVLAGGLHDVTATLNHHTANLDEHSTTLNKNTAILDDTSMTLNEHTRLLNLILARLGGRPPAG